MKDSGLGDGVNLDQRNTAMTVMSDLLEMPTVIARSRDVRVRINGEPKEGTFQEWSDANVHLEQDGRRNSPFTRENSNIMTKEAMTQFADRQVLDFICGNTDRHLNNVTFRFRQVNGERRLMETVGIDNDTSFGVIRMRDRDRLAYRGLCPFPEDMLMMKQSTANAVLNLRKDTIEAALLPYIHRREELDACWERVQGLQKQIKADQKYRWAGKYSLADGHIRIFKDDDPIWDSFRPGDLKDSKSAFGLLARSACIAEETKRSLGEPDADDYELKKNVRGAFGNVRNRQALHGDPDAISKGSRCFDRIFGQVSKMSDQIQKDMNWNDRVDAVYIDGLPAKEYVRKYSPHHADNMNYVKAQVVAALTSGRHHVDMVMLRTGEDGKFKAAATEVTMDLSALNGQEHLMESTRENRRKSLLKDEEGRWERQKKVEAHALNLANRTADRKVEELIKNDPVRSEMFAKIPYREAYGKSAKDIERRVDQDAVAHEKARQQALYREREKQKMNAVKQAFAGDPRRVPIAREALNLAEAKKPAKRMPANQQNQAGNQQNPAQNQNQAQNQANQAGNGQGRRRRR